jgi:hypothetical protein
MADGQQLGNGPSDTVPPANPGFTFNMAAALGSQVPQQPAATMRLGSLHAPGSNERGEPEPLPDPPTSAADY